MTPYRILVVDDHPDSRAICDLILSRHGYAVSTAGDGETGLAAARSARPDAIILDLALPRLDGWGVLRELKHDAATERIPIVLFTADFFDADRQRAVEAGCAGFLLKPCSPEAILRAIRSCLPSDVLDLAVPGA